MWWTYQKPQNQITQKPTQAAAYKLYMLFLLEQGSQHDNNRYVISAC